MFTPRYLKSMQMHSQTKSPQSFQENFHFYLFLNIAVPVFIHTAVYIAEI